METTETLDQLLRCATEELQLAPSLHDLATERYQAVANRLGGDPVLAKYRPDIYPQGSFLIGTTTRPIGSNEVDLDFVCELTLDSARIEAVDVLKMLEDRLRAHGTYAGMVQPLKRCVRLNYANEFHMDILPAAPERPPNGTCIRVPDRKLEAWKPSNPKGFAAWFKQRGQLVRFDKAAAKVDPVPRHQSVEEKTALQQMVQLAKRARDKFFHRTPNDAPRSIVLTTLAGELYDGEMSTARAVHDVVNGMITKASMSSSPLEVRNPANTNEVLSEHWIANPNEYHQFRSWLDWFSTEWGKVLTARGIAAVERQLAVLFGDELIKVAVAKHASITNDLRKSGNLSVTRAGQITVGPGIAAIRQNTFFGGDDA